MAIDIYAGPLTRYYAGLWESQLQKALREQGKAYQRVYANAETSNTENEDSLSAAEMSALMQTWRDNLSKAFHVELKWEESPEAPYYTDQLAEFDEVYALSCYALTLDKNIAEAFPEDLDTLTDKVIKSVDKGNIFCFLGAVEFYMPDKLPGTGIFKITLPNDREILCSSTERLLQELEDLSQKVTGIPLSELSRLPEDIIFERYAAQKESLMLALLGLCKFYECALFSQKAHLPILLDY